MWKGGSAVWTAALPLQGCVATGKMLNQCVPQFLGLRNEGNDTSVVHGDSRQPCKILAWQMLSPWKTEVGSLRRWTARVQQPVVLGYLPVSATVSVWISPKADSERRIWIQLIHLRGDTGKTVGGWESETWMGERLHTGPVAAVGVWKWIPLGTSGSQHGTLQTHPTWVTQELQTLSTSLCPHSFGPAQVALILSLIWTWSQRKPSVMRCGFL